MYKENPEKIVKNRKKMDFAILPFWRVSGQDFFPPGFLGRFQYRTPRSHISSPTPNPFSAENVFFFHDFGRFQTFAFCGQKIRSCNFSLFGRFWPSSYIPNDSSDDFSTERPVFTSPRPTLTRFWPKTCFLKDFCRFSTFAFCPSETLEL